MLGSWAWLALAGITALASELGQQPIGDALHPFPEYGNQALGIDPLSEPGVSAIVIPLFTEVTSSTEAEYARARTQIKHVAESPKLAADHAKARKAELEDLILSFSSDTTFPTANRVHRVYRVGDSGRDDASPEDEEVKEDEPATSTLFFDAKFTDFHALHRFAFAMRDAEYDDVSITALSWSLSRDAQFDALHKLRYEAMRELHVAVKEYVKVYDVDIVGIEAYSDHFRVVGAFEGESEVRLDLRGEDEIREFFAEDPDVVKSTKVGAVRIALSAECKFLAQKG